MSKKLIPCRVCGKLFTPCKNCADHKSAFHWREVACSRECFAEYMQQVTDGRAAKAVAPSPIVISTIPQIEESFGVDENVGEQTIFQAFQPRTKRGKKETGEHESSVE